MGPDFTQSKHQPPVEWNLTTNFRHPHSKFLISTGTNVCAGFDSEISTFELSARFSQPRFLLGFFRPPAPASVHRPGSTSARPWALSHQFRVPFALRGGEYHPRHSAIRLCRLVGYDYPFSRLQEADVVSLEQVCHPPAQHRRRLCVHLHPADPSIIVHPPTPALTTQTLRQRRDTISPTIA
ncbi:uncharacterized protein ARMOST_20264 [Armillaria ostoyae]|uniref:Uncharacterized protein n=1 Tax=Armillaria ostoyae TaxID=47428 RepID=A0A284S6V8_ARMOS|nr:uncharacterized protein ARMOST_20264 [Armillaria ostoyae]